MRWPYRESLSGRGEALTLQAHGRGDRQPEIIDLQAEITALRGAVRMLLHNACNADESALAIHREKAFQLDRSQGPGGRE